MGTKVKKKSRWNQWWENRSRGHILKIKEVLTIIEQEAPEWLQKSAEPTQGTSEEPGELDIVSRVSLAIKIYQLRREGTQQFRNFLWIGVAIAGAIGGFYKLFILV